MTRPLEGRHALITGAGRGIGAAIARRLAQDGARLTLVGRQLAPLQALADELGALALLCDVTDSLAVIDTFARAGRVDILVNNAGQAASSPLERTSDALWQQMLAVNLTGTFHCLRAAVPGMKSSGWGRIVNVASTAAQRGYAYVAAYTAAKHGVLGLTRSAALELATKGITVNAVCPGYTDTDLLAESIANVVGKTGRTVEAARAEFAKHNPQGRLIQPEEVAAAVAWLCSEGAAGINGQALSISGGEVMS
jgi:NAD(P)-dependent dehydrogenase (short-subunit alcohol dehydrogenase family)